MLNLNTDDLKKTNKQKDPLNSTWLYCKNKNSQIKLTAHLKNKTDIALHIQLHPLKTKSAALNGQMKKKLTDRSGTWTEETYSVYKYSRKSQLNTW